MAQSEPVQLDLSRFSSRDDALQQIRRDRGFDDIAFQPLQEAVTRSSGALTLLSMFTMSAISRTRGLHEGIVREIEHENPDAVFPLIRAFAETLLVVAYVADRLDYVNAIMWPAKDRKPGAPKQKTIQALIAHMDRHYSNQFKQVYAELSDVTHYGSTAIWNPFIPSDREHGFKLDQHAALAEAAGHVRGMRATPRTVQRYGGCAKASYSKAAACGDVFRTTAGGLRPYPLRLLL